MSVNPGFGGQKFIPEVLAKIKMLKDMIKKQKLNVDIEVDGGINIDNVAEVSGAGADILVMGNAFYNSKDYSETVRIVRERCG
jgi:ribulose-phosphate 3-epimerase